MTSKKQKILETTMVTDQEALVRLLIPKGPVTRKHIIPAGKTILSQIGQKQMETAVFTWLRKYRSFTEVIISWAKEPQKWPSTIVKIHTFDNRDARPIWERENEGRKKLAQTIANIISTRKLIYLHVKPDGIYIATDNSNKFKAKTTLTAELLHTPDYQRYSEKDIGKEVPSADWEPYIEYTVTSLGEFTNIQRTPN